MAPSPFFTWLFLAMPLVIVGWGVSVAIVRWARGRRPQGDPEGLLLGAVSRSLHERGELAASLGQLRTVHERLLDALPFGLLWVDQQGKVAALNRAGQALLGVTAGVGGLSADFVLEPHPWLREGLNAPAGSRLRVEQGPKVWRLHRIEAPDMVGALLQFEEVSGAEAEGRRQQLQARFAELGEMTAGVAHQLKNGLAVIKGHGELLARGGHTEAAAAVLEEAEALGQVVHRFMLWAKPLEPRLQELDLREVAEGALREVQRRPLGQGRRLELEGQGTAEGDPILLQQALINLLENACQASPAGGEVRIRVATGLVEVLDQGPGMGEETVVRMLRPFESGRPDGTGLGLPLALKWASAMGADLQIARRSEGGTSAVIRW
ncbi:MAG TPA: ATP-binding protein [Holophagaceae bacterium]|nr:ATP-binding protein [Holophagaceae bacterium]